MRLAVEDGEDVFGYIMWFAIDVVSQSMGKMSNCGSASGFLKQALFFLNVSTFMDWDCGRIR